jgi:hypothetical protein
MTSEWVTVFVVVDEEWLYIYTSLSQEPAEIFSIRSCSVRENESGVNIANWMERHTFSVVCGPKNSYSEPRVELEFAAGDSKEISDWKQTIMKFSECCTLCSGLHNVCSLSKRIEVCVKEAKDIYPKNLGSGVAKLATFCWVLLDDVKWRKTSIKYGMNPFWSEEFKFK